MFGFFFLTFNNSEKLGVFIAYVQMGTISGAQWSGTILEAQWVQFQMGTISAALKTINGNTYHILQVTCSNNWASKLTSGSIVSLLASL